MAITYERLAAGRSILTEEYGELIYIQADPKNKDRKVFLREEGATAESHDVPIGSGTTRKYYNVYTLANVTQRPTTKVPKF